VTSGVGWRRPRPPARARAALCPPGVEPAAGARRAAESVSAPAQWPLHPRTWDAGFPVLARPARRSAPGSRTAAVCGRGHGHGHARRGSSGVCACACAQVPTSVEPDPGFPLYRRGAERDSDRLRVHGKLLLRRRAICRLL
jgi:hypothetical protein